MWADIAYPRPLLDGRQDGAGSSSSSSGHTSAAEEENNQLLFRLAALSKPETIDNPNASSLATEHDDASGYRLDKAKIVQEDEIGSPTEEMFLDLFDAFLGSQATALPQSAGAAELVTGTGLGGYQQGQYVDHRTVQASRRVTACAVRGVEGKRYVMAVAASDLLNNHIAFLALPKSSTDFSTAEAPKSQAKPGKWLVVPWKKGAHNSIVSLAFSADGSRLLVASARALHVVEASAAVAQALGEATGGAGPRDDVGDSQGGGRDGGDAKVGMWSWARKSPQKPTSEGRQGEGGRRLGGGAGAITRDAACLLRSSPSKIVSCLCWTRSADGAEVACCVARSGACTMFDLDSRAQLCQQEPDDRQSSYYSTTSSAFDVSAASTSSGITVRRAVHVKAAGHQTLLLCSTPQGGGPHFALLLECKDPSGSVNGHEQLPEAAILPSFRVRALKRGAFGTGEGSGGRQLSVHRPSGPSQSDLVACHDTVLNTLELYDADRPADPVFLHQLPPATSHIAVTASLVFAVHGPHRACSNNPHDGGGGGSSSGNSSDHSTPAPGTTTGALFSSFDWIGIEDAAQHDARYFVTAISRFIADPGSARGSAEPASLVLQQSEFPSHNGKPHRPLGAIPVAGEALLWTDTGVFTYCHVGRPEDLFHRLLCSRGGAKKAELMALALRLDILGLYKVAACRALKRGDFGKAEELFELAGLGDLDVSCELLAAQHPAKALAMVRGKEGMRARVLAHAAIAMERMQVLAEQESGVGSDAASAAALAIADWALVCCRRGGSGGRVCGGEKAFRLLVSAAVLASISSPNGGGEEASGGEGRALDAESEAALRSIHESDFGAMLDSMMRTGAVSNLPFATEEDLISLLTRDVSAKDARGRRSSHFELGSGERAVSALFAMQARLGDGEEAEGERSRLQADLERIMESSGGGGLDRAWALPACASWNNPGAAAALLRSSGCHESAIVCRLLEVSSRHRGADEGAHCDAVCELFSMCEAIDEKEKCARCLHFLLVYWRRAGLPVGSLERGISEGGLPKSSFCSALLEAEKRLASSASEEFEFFSGAFLWEVAQKSCAECPERSKSLAAWEHIRRQVVGGNAHSRNASSRKIVVGAADLRRAGRGRLVVFSCGHHYTEREYQDRVLPSLERALGSLPRALPLTTSLLIRVYGRGKVNLGCPVCAYNAIAAKFAKPAVAPTNWIG